MWRPSAVDERGDWSGSNLFGANVLLTGGTGLIGGEILRRLIDLPVERVYCIVRGSVHDGVSRIRKRLCGTVDEAVLQKKVRVVSGDFAKDKLGISAASSRELSARIDLIFHCAAITSFLQDKACWEVNFEGTRRLTEMCRGFEKDVTFFHFGSSSTCGSVCDVVLKEDDFPIAGNDYFAPYASSKAAVELEIFADEADLDIVILRPSMVVPTGKLPHAMVREVAWSLALMQQCSALPIDPEAFVDIVPLDFVGEYSMRVAGMERKHRSYHLTAGKDGAKTIRSMLKIVSKSFGEDQIELLQGEHWQRHLITMSRREKVMVRQISPYFPFINQSVIFDNTRVLEECGHQPADRFDLAHHLPDIIRSMSVSEALWQSRHD